MNYPTFKIGTKFFTLVNEFEIMDKNDIKGNVLLKHPNGDIKKYSTSETIRDLIVNSGWRLTFIPTNTCEKCNKIIKEN